MVFLALAGNGRAVDWEQTEKDYQTTKFKLLETGPRTRPYVWSTSEMTWVADPRPEVGIGAHGISELELDLLRASGLQLVRRTLYWNLIENTDRPGIYDDTALAAWDAEIALLLRKGIIPLILVHGNPPGTNYAQRVEGYDRFAKFMAFVAKRWPGVRYWELFNEMDEQFTDLFGAGVEPLVPMRQRGQMYAEMLKRVTPEIRKANPMALVVVGGMNDVDEFPRGIYEGGGRNFFDIMSIHTYGVPLQSSFVLRGSKVRDIMNANGDSNKPLWNTEFGVDAGNLFVAWGLPKGEKPGNYFDRVQKEMIADCIEFNERTGLYQMVLPYQLVANNEAARDALESVEFGEKLTQDDFGFGFLRVHGDIRTPRPVFQWLLDRQINASLSRRATAVLEIAGPSDTATETRTLPLERAYPSLLILKPDQTVKDAKLERPTQKTQILSKEGKPFFPLGFVFGTSDADLKAARALGMNSVHAEYLPLKLFPTEVDSVDSAAVTELHELHRRIAAHGMSFFPLLNAHGLPPWLSTVAGGPPKDARGEKIGLWFNFSLHDPVFLNFLRKYWTVIATEFGTDPNVYSFVSWNEPGYGLDATPAALANFRNDMHRRYGTMEAFNRAVNAKFDDWNELPAPQTPDDNRAYWYEWVRFHQQTFAAFFADQRRFFKSIAPNAKFSGKHPVSVLSGDALWCNDIPSQALAQDIYGCDLYNGSIYHYRNSMEAARCLSGGGPVITYETRPQVGLKPPKPGPAVIQLLAQIIGGCRGMFFFDWDANNKEHGFNNDTATPPPVRRDLTRLFQAINANQAAFASARPAAEIAVLTSNFSSIHYGTGPDPTAREEYARRLTQTYDLLRNQHFAVDFIADSQLDATLAKYRLLVLPSLSILDSSGLAAVERFRKNGGKLLAFAEALTRNEHFETIPLPVSLGLETRTPAPFNRGMLRLVEVTPELTPWFRSELTVQKPEIVNPVLPEKTLIPGEVIKTGGSFTPLAANQDAFASILLTHDGGVLYCAFDSLYSEGLSRLLGGLLVTQFDLHPELSIVRDGNEVLEALTARTVGEDGTEYFWIANAGPNPANWQCHLPNGAKIKRLTDLVSTNKISVTNGAFTLTLPPYGYAILTAAHE